jgi:glycosyltransferase involved in cell wall biosynthesis
LAAGLELKESVVFAGMREDVAAILRASAVALLPSDTEALPTTLIEAAACGVPAVAHRVGGVPEVVADGKTGVLVDPGNVSGLASALRRVLADESLRVAMGRSARVLAEQRFSSIAWARRLRAVYDRALTGEPITGAAEPPDGQDPESLS